MVRSDVLAVGGLADRWPRPWGAPREASFQVRRCREMNGSGPHSGARTGLGGRGPTLVGDPGPSAFTSRATSRLRQDKPLSSMGPIEHLRHPSYTGAILMFAGVGIGLGERPGPCEPALCSPRSASYGESRVRRRCSDASSASRTPSTPVTRRASYRAFGEYRRRRSGHTVHHCRCVECGWDLLLWDAD